MVKIIAIAYGLLLVLVFFAQRKMLYHPYQAPEEFLVKLGKVRGMEPWRTPDGKLIGWKQSSTNNPKGRLLIVHGNAGCALDRADYADTLLKVSPFDVYVLEYPGFGARPGSISQRSLFAAADEALGVLPADGPIYVIGESLGTGVAAYLAGTHAASIAGVLLVAPYHHMTEVGQHHMPLFPVALMLLDRFPSASYLRTYHGPVAVLLAGQDTIVPNRFGRKLYDTYDGPKKVWEIADAGHNDVGDRPIEWWRELVEFWRLNLPPNHRPSK